MQTHDLIYPGCEWWTGSRTIYVALIGVVLWFGDRTHSTLLHAGVPRLLLTLSLPYDTGLGFLSICFHLSSV
jgi:hypothetical protein